MPLDFTNDQLWHTPIKAYSDYLAAAEKEGVDAINKLGKHQKIRETRALAILCFAMYKSMGTPWYVQLDESEKSNLGKIPDARIMRLSPTTKGDLDLLRVEHTSYIRHNDGKLPRESLLEQLKRTKSPSDKHHYDDSTLVLVELGVDFSKEKSADFKAIAEYLRSIGAPYQLWCEEEIQNKPDTIVRISICTPEFHQLDLNIGEAWQEQLDNNIRGTIVARPTDDASIAGVVTPSSNPATRPVWEFK